MKELTTSRASMSQKLQAAPTTQTDPKMTAPDTAEMAVTAILAAVQCTPTRPQARARTKEPSMSLPSLRSSNSSAQSWNRAPRGRMRKWSKVPPLTWSGRYSTWLTNTSARLKATPDSPYRKATCHTDQPASWRTWVNTTSRARKSTKVVRNCPTENRTKEARYWYWERMRAPTSRR